MRSVSKPVNQFSSVSAPGGVLDPGGERRAVPDVEPDAAHTGPPAG
jgi:hypothetical protein